MRHHKDQTEASRSQQHQEASFLACSTVGLPTSENFFKGVALPLALIYNALVPKSMPNMWKCDNVLKWQGQLCQLDKKWTTQPVADAVPPAANAATVAVAAAVTVVETTADWVASHNDE